MTEPKFTDEDLKRLKEGESDAGYFCLSDDERFSLLARLEAAEAIVNHFEETPEGSIIQEGYEPLLEAWHKASGK